MSADSGKLVFIRFLRSCLNRFALAISSAMLVFIHAPAMGAGGDFSQDFTAAAPLTYDHAIGGGAYDDRTVGKNDDIVESLEGGDFACGDLVTFLTQIEVEDVPATPGAQTIDIDYEFTAHSTGQQGTALADIVNVLINYGSVVAGDGPGGTDSGISDDGGSTASLIAENVTGPVFVKGSVLEGTVRIDDLEAGENVVLRMDVRIACQPGSNPTGNMQGRLASARVFSSNNDAISGGDQTIPFKKVGQIEEPAIEFTKKVTTENGDCATAQDLIEVPLDTTVKYCYKVTNPTATAPLLNVRVVDDNGTPGALDDDFEVTLTSGLTNEDNDGTSDDLAPGAMATGVAFRTFGVSDIGPDTINIAEATADGVSATDDATVRLLLPTLNPQIEIIKEVSRDGVSYVDANDAASALGVPLGDSVYYRFRIRNAGDADLVDVKVSDALLNITDFLIGDLAVGASVTLASGQIGALLQPDLCSAVALINNIAIISATEPIFQTPLLEGDPANVQCVREGITIVKEVSVDNGSTYFDANDIASAPTAALGTNALYRLTVTNTGSSDLSNVTVNDAALGIGGYLVGNLGAGVTVVLEQGQIPQLSAAQRCQTPDPAVNTAGVNGTVVLTGTVVNDTDPAVIDCVREGIKLVKEISIDGGANYFDANDANSAPAVAIGGNALYRITLENTGTADLYNVVVNDASLGILNQSVANISAGQTIVLSSGEISQLNQPGRCDAPGDIVNIADVSALVVGTDNQVTDDDPAVLVCVREGIEIIKEVSVDNGSTYFDANDLGSAPSAALGTGALYRITVTNTGSSELKDVVVNDATLGIVNHPIGNLGAGVTVVLDEGDIPALEVPQRCNTPDPAINTATAEGTVILTNNEINDTDPAVIDCVREGIKLIKEISIDGGNTFFDANQSIGAPAVGLGGDALYRITLENVGTADLYDLLVNDLSLGIVNYGVPSLLSGQTIILTEVEIPPLSQPERCLTPGDITNIADVSAFVVGTNNEVTDSDPAVLRCLEELIDVRKEVSIDGGSTYVDANDGASAPVASLGGDALYRFIIENIGTARLVDVQVIDAELGIDTTIASLEVGQQIIVSSGQFPQLYQPGRCQQTGDVTNIVSVVGTSELTGNPVSDSDPAVVRCVSEMIKITKEVSVDGGVTFFDANSGSEAPFATLGEGAIYRFTLMNTGTADLTGLVVNDADLGIVNYFVGNLSAGQTVVLTEGEIGALQQPALCQVPGDLTNIAFVDAVSASTGASVTDSDPAVVRCVREAINIIKEVSVDGGITYFDANDDTTAPSTGIGAGALYRIRVVNIGTVDLQDILINDSTLGITNYLIPYLSTGSSIILTEAVLPSLDQPDLCQVPGDVTNVATASGQSVATQNTVSDSDTAIVTCLAEAAGLLILDEDAIDNGLLYWLGNVINPNQNNGIQFRKREVNDNRPGERQRAPLPFFVNNVGEMYKLQTGQVGDEGWFAPQTIPSTWGDETDGLTAFVEGTLSQNQLDKIPDVAPLRATGLLMLEGGTYCAVVYDSDVSINYDPLNGNLQGETLGIAAFSVEIDGVEKLNGFSSSSLPTVLITVLDPTTVCNGPLMTIDVPDPGSSSEPFDIDPENLTGGYN